MLEEPVRPFGPAPTGTRFVLGRPPPAYQPIDNEDEYPGAARRREREGNSEADNDRRVRPRRGRDPGESDEDESRVAGGGADDGEEEVPEFYFIPCDDVAEAENELGQPGPRNRCFACRYVGQNKSAKIPDVRMRELFSLMAEGIGNSWPSALAVEISILYEKCRIQVNKTAKEGEKLPKWSPASVLDHWHCHTNDPEIRQWLDLCHCQYTVEKIRRCSLQKKSRRDGAVIHDREQATIMNLYMRTWYMISAKDPRKMSYFCEGDMFDRGSVSTGGFSIKGRRVYNFFRKDSKRRTPGAGNRRLLGAE